MPKRLVLCCDGTWNTASQERAGRLCPTNVTKVALGLTDEDAAGVRQLVYYQQGVGTTRGERLRGGALGLGLSRNVQDAYRFVVENYVPGDEIFLFGFSRGAYTARSVVGLIRNSGVLRREHAGRLQEAYRLYRDRARHPRGIEAQLFRRSFSHEPRVRCIGVWDTVGALGIPVTGPGPARLLNKRWEFHDTMLSSIVDAAFQALAIDEQRRPFEPTLWQSQPHAHEQRVEQVWFSGDHSDVGGGYEDSALADIALLWMVDRARSCGLAFREDAYLRPADGGPREYDGRTFPVDPDPAGELHDARRLFFRLLPPHHRPIGEVDRASESAASSAVQRLEDPQEQYAPRELITYLDAAGRVTEVLSAGSADRTGQPPADREAGRRRRTLGAGARAHG